MAQGGVQRDDFRARPHFLNGRTGIFLQGFEQEGAFKQFQVMFGGGDIAAFL